MAAPGAGYKFTHADLNALMLFPWPNILPVNITAGQVGRHSNITWRQYLAVIGEFWEATYNYPIHTLKVDGGEVGPGKLAGASQIFGLCVRAMVERGYLNPVTGQITPPVPFADPPARFRDKPPGWGA